jgi:Transposase IS116/IS110/IS902 family
VVLLLSNTVQNAIIGPDNSLLGGLLGAAVLLAANYTTVRLGFQHPALSRALEGTSTVLVEKGRTLDGNLRRYLITKEELMAAIRRQGGRNLQTSRWWSWRPPASTGSPSGMSWRSGAWRCCWSTPGMSRFSPAARPMSVTRPGWRSCWSMGCCGAASCRRRPSASWLGVSGRAMLAALVGGERDPKVLGELARGRLRTKLPQLRQALRGRFSDHHALLVGLALEHLEHLEGAIATLDTEVDRVLAPFARARDQLDTITGVGKRAAETIIAEIGVDMAVFPTAGHLASWAGRCPGNNLTGGKRRSGRPTRGNRWLGEVLTECAWAAARSRDTYLAAQYWRLARRIGKQEGGQAVGHSILVIAWYLLANDCDYQDLGGDFFVRRDADRARQRAVAQLQALGYRVTLEPLAA